MSRIIITALIALLFVCCSDNSGKISIIHTNDTHSHILPEKDGSGGVLNRALLVEHLRDSLGADNTLLLDCGDFSQGSLFYNVFRGTFEVDIMNAMKYDAVAIGNHEFDFGMDNLAKLIKRAEFPVICANYDFTNTVCEGLVKPYVIIECNGRKIGVFALSPNPEGLVLKENYAGVKYLTPSVAAQECADELRKAGCDAVVCLSHLGWKTPGGYNDERLIAETSGIDMILGGHSHDLFERPLSYKNSAGEDVLLQQAGKYGRNLGIVDIIFE